MQITGHKAPVLQVNKIVKLQHLNDKGKDRTFLITITYTLCLCRHKSHHDVTCSSSIPSPINSRFYNENIENFNSLSDYLGLNPLPHNEDF